MRIRLPATTRARRFRTSGLAALALAALIAAAPSGPGSNYAPAECRWVQVAKKALEADSTGRMVYEITQKNSCTGKRRTFRAY